MWMVEKYETNYRRFGIVWNFDTMHIVLQCKRYCYLDKFVLSLCHSSVPRAELQIILRNDLNFTDDKVIARGALVSITEQCRVAAFNL